MANQSSSSQSSSDGMISRLRRIGIGQAIMYVILTLWAIFALFPFFAMISTSLMTLGEANGAAGSTLRDRLIPRDISWGSDISGCILVATDTFFDTDIQATTTQTRVVIDIPPEVENIQGYGFRSANTANSSIQRVERFRIPFFSNYCAAWSSADLGRYMWNTVWIVGITLVGTLFVSIMAAYAFARMEFIGKELIFALMLSTLMIPGIVTNLPNLLLIVGIQNWLQETWVCGTAERCLIGNWPALTIPFMAQAINIFLMRQHFASIPIELWEAARIDGAGHVRFLIRIILPLSTPVLFVVILFTFIGAWNELAWALLATPGDDTWRPIAVGLQQFLTEEGSFTHLRMAGAMITIVPILILYALTQRSFIEGLSQSGLKG